MKPTARTIAKLEATHDLISDQLDSLRRQWSVAESGTEREAELAHKVNTLRGWLIDAENRLYSARRRVSA